MPSSKAGVYNGWIFGNGTKYHVAGMSGFFDLPDVVTTDQPRPFVGGLFPGVDRKGGLTVTLGIIIIADSISDYDSLVDAMCTATDVQTAEKPLQVFGSTRYIMCRPRKRTIPIECEDPIPTFKVPQDGITIEFFSTTGLLVTGTPP